MNSYHLAFLPERSPPVVPMARKFKDYKKMDFHSLRYSEHKKLIPQYRPGDSSRINRITDKPVVFLWPGRGGIKSNWLRKAGKGYPKYKYVFLNRSRRDFVLVHELKTYCYWISTDTLIPDQIWIWREFAKIWDRIR